MFRSKPVQALEDRRAYIPPHIENVMAEHVQQSMPAHLQKYRGGNTYIPEHTQNEMTQHLENALPTHMKQYAGAYMQQRVVEPSLAKRAAVTPPAPPDGTTTAARASVIHPDPRNLSAQPAAPASAPSPVAFDKPQSSYAEPAGQTPSADQPYQFITNPQKPPKQSALSGFFGNAGLPVRVGLIAGGLIVLVILFAVFRSLLSSSPDLTSFVTVAQEQQELIHLVASNPQQASLPANTQNLAATMQASLTTSQGQTIQYLTNNKQKISTKQLNLKVSAATDTQLANAAAAATYSQTYTEILRTKLSAYEKTLSQGYNQTKGKKGRALLSDSYRQAQLFQAQLNEPAN